MSLAVAGGGISGPTGLFVSLSSFVPSNRSGYRRCAMFDGADPWLPTGTNTM